MSFNMNIKHEILQSNSQFNQKFESQWIQPSRTSKNKEYKHRNKMTNIIFRKVLIVIMRRVDVNKLDIGM